MVPIRVGKKYLGNDLNCIEARHAKTAGFWDNLGSMDSAWGMIGT